VIATILAWLPSLDGPTELPFPATVVIVYCPYSDDGTRQAIASVATIKLGVVDRLSVQIKLLRRTGMRSFLVGLLQHLDS
jgi:hypothetical protein